MLRSKPHKIERIGIFLRDKVVAIGWSATGNLSGATKEEIRDRLKNSFGYEGQSLSTNLGLVNSFVRVMKAGDLVLIREGSIVHIGKVGDYDWKDEYLDMHMAHTRSVEWISQVPFNELNASIQSLLKNIRTIARYPGTFDDSELGPYVNGTGNELEPELLEKRDTDKGKLMANTLEILKDLAHNATDESVRLEAAKEIMKYLK